VCEYHDRKDRDGVLQKLKVEFECIYVYSLAARELTLSRIDRTYGVANLYKDASNLVDPYEVERKLCILESEAGSVINKILTAADGEGRQPSVMMMQRREYYSLMKFTYIMRVRQQVHREEYALEDGNRLWIRNLCKLAGLKAPPPGVWLRVLKYYLDTPHEKIMARGRKMNKEALENSTGPFLNPAQSPISTVLGAEFNGDLSYLIFLGA
jgi:hypothetical protein